MEFLRLIIGVTSCAFLVMIYYEVGMTRDYLRVISSKLDHLIDATRRLRDDVPLNGTTGENDGTTKDHDEQQRS